MVYKSEVALKLYNSTLQKTILDVFYSVGEACAFIKWIHLDKRGCLCFAKTILDVF